MISGPSNPFGEVGHAAVEFFVLLGRLSQPDNKNVVAFLRLFRDQGGAWLLVDDRRYLHRGANLLFFFCLLVV